jgi:PAS domain S-box-containing protein
MKLRNLPIRTRLILGFTALTLVTAVMGLFALLAIRYQSQVTVSMYRHPLTVSNTVRDIQNDIITMQRSIKDIVLSPDTNRTDELKALAKEKETRILAAYDLLEERFLGDSSSVTNARDAFLATHMIRGRVIELMSAGNSAMAADVLNNEGAQHAMRIQQLNTVLSDFASSKADEFYAQALDFDRQIMGLTAVLLVLLVMTSILVAFTIARSITAPMKVVIDGIKPLSEGRFEDRIDLDRGDELGQLATAINDMADSLSRSTTTIETLNTEVQARRKAEERADTFGEIIERSLNEVFIIDAETYRFLEVSRSGLMNLGYTHDEILSMTPLDIDAGFDKESMMELITPLFDGRKNRVFLQSTLTRRDGSDYPVEIDLQSGSYGGRTVLIAMTTDVTIKVQMEKERRALEEHIQHTQKLESLGVLAGGIAHDFNNILMTILGNAALALEDLPGSSPVRESVESIESASRRAADLCRQMLAYSGKGKFQISAVNLSTLVEEIVNMIEVSISKKALLKYNLAVNLPDTKADATQLGQVVLNLITNASDAIGDRSGIISITTGVQYCDEDYIRTTKLDRSLLAGDYVYLEVSDTGCGMDKDVQRRMFEPFFTTKFTGRGLGMAAVMGIIRGHSGAIKIYSEVGQGTTIKVLLPVSEDSEPVVESDSNHQHYSRSGDMALLVDDEETVRVLGRRILERMGYEVLLAEDGRVGINLFNEHANDIAIVILDLTMPHIGGQEAFREIRRIREDVPIILSSGYNAQEVTQHFVGRGLAGFIQKPYQHHELAAKLNEVLGG